MQFELYGYRNLFSKINAIHFSAVIIWASWRRCSKCAIDNSPLSDALADVVTQSYSTLTNAFIILLVLG